MTFIKQNSFRPLLISFLLFIVTIIFFGCGERLYFENPKPDNADIVKVLPDFLEGKFKVLSNDKDDLNFVTTYEFFRLNDQHVIVNEIIQIPLDSLTSFLDKDKDYLGKQPYKIENNIITMFEKDSIYSYEITKNKNVNIEEGKKFELDLAKNMLFGFDGDDKENRCLLMLKDDQYVLNVFENNLWHAILFEEKNNGIDIIYSSIDSKVYEKNKTYFNGISKIEKEEFYISFPENDNEFFMLMEESDLINKQVLIKIVNEDFKTSSKSYILIGLIVLVFIIVLGSVISKRKKQN